MHILNDEEIGAPPFYNLIVSLAFSWLTTNM